MAAMSSDTVQITGGASSAKKRSSMAEPQLANAIGDVAKIKADLIRKCAQMDYENKKKQEESHNKIKSRIEGKKNRAGPQSAPILSQSQQREVDEVLKALGVADPVRFPRSLLLQEPEKLPHPRRPGKRTPATRWIRRMD